MVSTELGMLNLTVFFHKLLYLLQSLVSGDLYEFYIFDLYLEQISLDEDHVDTRLRFHRMLATPLLPRPVFTENRKSNDKTFVKWMQL